MDMNTSDLRRNRTQRSHPAFPSFLAHPRHCCYEVEARPEQVPSESPRTSHQRNGDIYVSNWLSEVQWTGYTAFENVPCVVYSAA